MSASAVTLREAFRAALNRSEDLASQAELVNQAEESYRQAIGSIFPTINFVGTYSKQQENPRPTNISPTDQQTYRVTASQPLFQGFREYAALRQTSILQKGAEFGRQQAKTQLFQDTAVAFYQVMMSEADHKNLLTQIEVNQKRLKELQGFRKLGRSRQSEVLTLQSNIATLEARLESAKILVRTNRALFSFLTGLEEPYTLVDHEKIPETLKGKGEYLTGVEKRFDLAQARENVRASEEDIKIARGAHYPTLTANGNYYLKRPGFLSDVKWDVSLNLVFPIFQGGVIQSQVRTAASTLKQSELTAERTRRLAIQTVTSLYEQAKGDLELIEKQSRATELSQRNYETELKEYRLGLVNNVEVLQILTASQENRRALDQSRYQYKIDYLRLMAQTGARPNDKD